MEIADHWFLFAQIIGIHTCMLDEAICRPAGVSLNPSLLLRKTLQDLQVKKVQEFFILWDRLSLRFPTGL